MAAPRRQVSAATRAKLSKANKGRKATKATRAKESKAQRGKHRTAAQRKAESKRERGKKHPHKGHKLTAAQRKKASAQRTGRKHPHRGGKQTRRRPVRRPHPTGRPIRRDMSRPTRHLAKHMVRQPVHGQPKRSTPHGKHAHRGRGYHPRSFRRGHIYPGYFKHGRSHTKARFIARRRKRGNFTAGRRHLHSWKR